MTTNSATYQHFEDIPIEEQELIKLAKLATKNAYAPYSNFHVGASILLDNGEIITAANQENAAYPSGLCAERVAIFNIMSNHKDKKIKKIAIVANKGSKDNFVAVSPCGSCRQVMLEQEQIQSEPIEVIFQYDDVWFKILTIKELLPFSFNKNTLISGAN